MCLHYCYKARIHHVYQENVTHPNLCHRVVVLLDGVSLRLRLETRMCSAMYLLSNAYIRDNRVMVR